LSNDSTIPTPATPDVCTIAILIEGNQIPGELHVLSVLVTNELNRIPTAMVQLRDGEAAKSTFEVSNGTLFIPGKKIEIKLGYRSSNDTVFTGIIVKHSIKVRKNGSILIAECRDPAVKMTCGAKSRYFSGKKDSDIIEEIIRPYSLKKDVSTTKPALKEVTQFNATDWDFMLCRAEANGHVVIVKDGKITVAPPGTGTTPVVTVHYGSTLLELDAEIDARVQSKRIKAFTWDAAGQAIVDVDAKEPTTPSAGNITPGTLADVIGQPHQIRHGGHLTQPELQAWADGRLLKERLAKVRGRVKFQGFAKVDPGTIIEITGIGDRFEGKLYVSGVRQTVSNGNWETNVQFGLDPEMFAQTYNLRPMPAAGLIPAVSGLHAGVVTALKGDPEGEDRIKVRVPLIDKADDGIWARLATLDAGKNRGTFFRPELHDEVIVGFINDDPRHPVVLGMCNSSAKPAPEPADDDNHRKGYVSRSNMKFTFDDQKKIILIETPSGNRMTLSEQEKGILIQDQNDNKITMDNNGIKIESSKDITLKAAKDVKVEGMNLDLKAQTGFKAAGTASAEVSGASTTVKGSATTVIQGGLVQIN
jgi:Rhs element Vgr protein